MSIVHLWMLLIPCFKQTANRTPNAQGSPSPNAKPKTLSPKPLAPNPKPKAPQPPAVLHLDSIEVLDANPEMSQKIGHPLTSPKKPQK